MVWPSKAGLLLTPAEGFALWPMHFFLLHFVKKNTANLFIKKIKKINIKKMRSSIVTPETREHKPF